MGLPLFAPRREARLRSLDPYGEGNNVRLPRVMSPEPSSFARGREVAALLLWSGALFLVLALASYRTELGGVADDGVAEAALRFRSVGDNWAGFIGETAAGGLVRVVGVLAWAVPLELLLLGIPFVRARKSNLTPQRVAGNFLVMLLAASMVQVGWPEATAFGAHGASGAVGELFGEVLRSLFSTIGSFLVGFASLGLVLIGRASFSFIALVRWLMRMGNLGARRTADGAQKLADAWREARDIERSQREAERVAALPHIEEPGDDEAVVLTGPLLARTDSEPLPATPAVRARGAEPLAKRAVAEPVEAEPLDDIVHATPESIAPVEAKPRRKRAAKAAEPPPEDVLTAATTPTDFRVAPRAPAPTPESDPDLSDLHETTDPPASAVVEAAPKPRAKKAPLQLVADEEPAPASVPQIVDTAAALEAEAEKAFVPEPGDVVISRQKFNLPSIDFLAPAKFDPSVVVDKQALFENAELLIKTLADYGVSGKVEEILPGPTVTTYEVSPAAGTKVSKVAGLADDLALALARKVRIVAPIPGKNRIGFELPNVKRAPVNLRDLVEDARFQSLDAPLPVVMGRDIVGNPVYADLASMPHVIVAGATGAGKSVGLNVMLTSLLYRRTPDDLRMLMIDPKVVELAPFDRIPHMLLPVVTDMKQAANALKWAVDEMERRYQLFADAGTKNISTYNNWVERVARGEVKNPLVKTVKAKDFNGFVDDVPATDGEVGEVQLPEKMPFIVIVVDEFADLMMQQGKEVETAVARLAQKARAAGMHVILATQRPSVDVITGMIKANFPTRIAFRVAQKIDSRTILDEQGAEHLLGRGDMLIRLNGTNDTKRVQCPWVSEEEVNEITDFLRAQGEPVYDENILKPRDEDGGPAADEDAEQDALYDDAVRIVAETRRCSTSWLQRKLGLGYNRAARIVEMMERRGLVGPANGSKDREVLIEAH